jgi:hypothetical protein
VAERSASLAPGKCAVESLDLGRIELVRAHECLDAGADDTLRRYVARSA